MHLGLRIYLRLLASLPEPERSEYGDEMRRVVEDGWASRRDTRGGIGVGFWLRENVALWKTARRWRRAHREREGRTMGSMFDGWSQDLGLSLRALRRRPGFAIVSALTLGVGIGASTAVFSAVHTVLLRDLPYGAADRLLHVAQMDRETGEVETGASAANMLSLSTDATFLDAAAVAEPWSYDLIVEGRAETLKTWAVSEGFLEGLDLTLSLGRSFSPEDYLEGADPVVLLSWSSFVGRFGADSAVVGRTLSLEGNDHTVIGVLPSEVTFPGPAELWSPRPVRSWDATARGAAYMTGVARLAPGASLAQAQAEADRVALAIAEIDPAQSTGLGFRLTPLRDHLFGSVRTPLLVLASAVGLVLLIACANVAGLFVARGIERRREFALRDALGAGRARLVRLMGLESGVLSLAGAGLGIAIAFGSVAGLRALGPDHLPRIDQLAVDRTVLLFALVTGAASAILSGLLPALRSGRTDPSDALREGAAGISHTRGGIRLRRRLVVLEVAGAVVLLVGSGLLIRSFGAILDEELGFDPVGRLALQTFAYGYEDFEGGRQAFVQMAVDNLGALPGVTGVALTTNVPGADDSKLASIDVALPFVRTDRPAPPAGREPQAYQTLVSSSLFEVLDQPLLEGRAFSQVDGPDGTPVAIVNETFVRRYFPGESAIGRSILWSREEAPRTIIGVVADVRLNGHASPPRADVYLPLSQRGEGSLTFVLETEVAAAGLAEAAREAIWAANPLQAIWGVATLESLVADRLLERRFNLAVLGGFALIALFLASIGIYGLGSYSVRARRGEMGIRRALGGRTRSILAMILGEGTRLAALGVALGLVGSLFATRLLQGMLFGVEATDPLTLGAIAVVVLAAAVLAALVPALYAGRVHPAEALRSD